MEPIFQKKIRLSDALRMVRGRMLELLKQREKSAKEIVDACISEFSMLVPLMDKDRIFYNRQLRIVSTEYDIDLSPYKMKDQLRTIAYRNDKCRRWYKERKAKK
jgi:hypothetical protein